MLQTDRQIDYNFVATAYHEAGHVILALLSCFKVDRVQIFKKPKKIKNNNIYGLTTYYSPLYVTSSDFCKKVFAKSEVYVNYAGAISESILFESISGAKSKNINKNASVDNSTAIKIIKKFNILPKDQTINNFKASESKKIKNILIAFWKDVEIISNLFIKNNNVKFADIKRVLTKRSPNKNFWSGRFRTINFIIGSDNSMLDDGTLEMLIRFQEKLW